MDSETVYGPFGNTQATLYYGINVLDGLRLLEPESVQTVVTSPPYWGLRDYKTDPILWDADPECEHEWGDTLPHGRRGNRGVSGTGGNKHPTCDHAGVGAGSGGGGEFCQGCGAWRGQLGLEPTPELYVEHLVQVFQETWRVLRPDGTVWLNIGDCFQTTSGGGQQTAQTNTGAGMACPRIGVGKLVGVKGKDLIGIPWMVAFALRNAGWYLRSDIIWAKANCMPESVQDRPTRSHEYVFLLTKNPRYFCDMYAVREPVAVEGRSSGNVQRKVADGGEWSRTNSHLGFAVPWEDDGTGKNRRSVWNINVRPYAGAHFAVMPPDLADICVKAGTAAYGCCAACGTPWHRVSDKWEPGCSCEGAERKPCVVLDPFSGSGTTGVMAMKYGQNYIGLDLNPEYLELAKARLCGAQAPTGEGVIVTEGGALDLFGEADGA